VKYPGVPEALYHYTSVTALRGILASRSIWATCTSDLRDYIEIEHGRRIALTVGAERLKARPDEDPTLFIVERYGPDEPEGWALKTYLDSVAVASFTDLADDNNQWVNYGDQAAGVALMLDPRLMLEKAALGPAAWWPEWLLVSARYTLADNRELVDDTFEWYAKKLVDTFTGKDPERDPLDVCYGMAISFTSTLASMKHAAFAGEREWRLTTMVRDEWQLNPQTGRRYKPIDLWNDSDDCPIIGVQVGPAAPAATEGIVHAELKKAGLDVAQVPVGRSAIE